MKTKFEEFLKEYREVFNTDLALKKLLKGGHVKVIDKTVYSDFISKI